MSILPSHVLPAALASVAAPTARHVRLGAPGQDPEIRCIVLLCFDDSDSLSAGNDPIGARYQEAQRAVEHVAAASHTEMQQVGIFRFDHPVIPPVGPLPLNNKLSLAAVRNAVAPPVAVTGSSALTASMTAMNELAHGYGGTNRIAVIFSDFELFDHDLDQPYAQIAAFPGLVHAVVMNTAPPQRLKSLPNVLVTQVFATDPPGMLAAALTHSLTTFRLGATRPRICNDA